MNKIIVRKFSFEPRNKTVLILELMKKNIRRSGLEKVSVKPKEAALLETGEKIIRQNIFGEGI